MLRDKKRKGGTIDLILPYAIGDCRIYPVTIEQLKEIMHGVYQSAMASMKPGVYDGSYTLKPCGQDNAWVLPIPDYEIIFDRGTMVDNDKREPREKNEN